MFLLVSGASGAGKSTTMDHMRERWPDIVVHEDDEKPPSADTAGRQAVLSGFVEEAIRDQAAGRHTLFAGQSPLGELLACPLAIELDGIGACLFDCRDLERVHRVRRRHDDPTWCGEGHLCWASFHRMHAYEPTWASHVITNNGDPNMQWQRWTTWPADDPRWRVHRIDTTDLSIEQGVELLAQWVEGYRANPQSLPIRGQWWLSP